MVLTSVLYGCQQRLLCRLMYHMGVGEGFTLRPYVCILLLQCRAVRLLALQGCRSGVAVVLQWCYGGVTEMLQWCYSNVTVVSAS
jgi:hypothetical protein